MKRIKYNLRIYFLVATRQFKARMMYRADFIIGVIASLLGSCMGLFIILVMFGSVNSMQGWKVNELLFIYAFTLMASVPMSTFFNHVWSLFFEARSGSFVRYYFLPINTFVYYLSDTVNLQAIGTFALSTILFIVSIAGLGLNLSVFSILFLLAQLAGASLIYISIITIANTLCLYLNMSDVLSIFIYRFFEFAKFPTNIFHGFIKIILTYVIPVAFVGYFPTLFFLRPSEAGIEAFIAPVVGIIMFVLAYKFWNAGVKRYSGTGT